MVKACSIACLFLSEGLQALIYLAEPLAQLLLFLHYSEASQEIDSRTSQKKM